MQQSEVLNLIRRGIATDTIQHWADLGCGSGTFTIALASLLSKGSEIYAIDLKHQTLPKTHNGITIQFQQLDFGREQLPFAKVDGILMANSLHYIKDKTGLLQKLAAPRFIVVEYESRIPNPWVPYPINSASMSDLFSKLGYNTQLMAHAPSRFGGSMYSLLATR